MRVLLLLLVSNLGSTDTRPSTSTGQPKLDCSDLCSGSDHDQNVGDCCSTQYCHCSEEGDSSQYCENGEKFCPAVGECRDQYGVECQERPDCCTSPTTEKSTATLSTTSPIYTTTIDRQNPKSKSNMISRRLSKSFF